MRRFWLFTLLIMVILVPTLAQDGLNLPSELYVLLNSGVIERYGIGASGVQTVTPDDVFILDFRVAPDGNWVAYRTETGVSLLNMYTGDTRSLENDTSSVPPIRGQGETLAWTANGDALAYTTLNGGRVYFNSGSPAPLFAEIPTIPLLNLVWSPDGSHLAAEAEDNIWWIYRRDGATMVLASAIPAANGTAWVGNAQLVFAPPEGGLILMDMANANTQTPLLNPTHLYSLPIMTDGGLLVFRRAFDETRFDESFGVLTSVTLQGGTATATETGTAAFDLSGLRWAPNGALLIAFRGGALGIVNPVDGFSFTLPIQSAVAYGWGPIYPRSVLGINVRTSGFFLAPDISGIIQVWQLNTSGAPAFTLTPAEEDVTAYAMSPDLRRVAYVSGGQLRYHTPDSNTEPADLAAVDATQLAFGPNGQQLAYTTDAGIWTVSVSGDSEPEPILVNTDEVTYSHPRYAPNVNLMLVRAAGQQTTQLMVVDLNTGELLGGDTFHNGLWLSDGRIAAYGGGLGGVNSSQVTVIDVVNQTEAETALTIPDILTIESVIEQRGGRLRVALSQAIPGAASVSIVDAVVGGESSPVGDAGFIVSPQLAPDGVFVAGYTYPGGALILHNVETGEGAVLLSPQNVHDFRWAGQ